jgi:hypothetical protein
LDCASAGTIITDASSPPMRRFERIDHVSVLEGESDEGTRRDFFCSWNRVVRMIFFAERAEAEKFRVRR